MSGTYTLKCGCVALIELERVVSLCAQHNQQWRNLHAQAIAEHARQAAQESQEAA